LRPCDLDGCLTATDDGFGKALAFCLLLFGSVYDGFGIHGSFLTKNRIRPIHSQIPPVYNSQSSIVNCKSLVLSSVRADTAFLPSVRTCFNHSGILFLRETV